MIVADAAEAKASVSAPTHISPIYTSLLLLSLASVVFSSTTHAQGTSQPTLSQGTLDEQQIDGPRWIRIDFESLASGSHTVEVLWNSNADVRFSVFDANGTRLNDQIVRGTNPLIWVGELEANEHYTLFLWSSGGVADYTASVSTEASGVPDAEIADEDQGTSEVLSAGTLDFTRRTAPRFTSIPVEPMVNGQHTISISWDSNANVRYNVLDSNGTKLNERIVEGSNPGIWAGELDVDENYSISLWSSDGIVNYTATISAEEIPTSASLTILSAPASMSIDEGDDANITVTAAGAGPLSYQWSGDCRSYKKNSVIKQCQHWRCRYLSRPDCRPKRRSGLRQC